MATEILPVGTSAVYSSDVTVAAGDQLTVSLKDAAGPDLPPLAQADLQLKDDAAQYFTVAVLTVSKPAFVIAAAGVYRFYRPGGVSCGVFSG